MSARNGGGAATAAPRRNGKPKGETKAKASKAAAAVAEVTPEALEQKVAKFGGLSLVLVEDLPKTFLWDLAASSNNALAYFELVQSLLTPEQLPQVRGALADYEGEPAEFIMELADAVLSEYGLTSGESEASQDS